MEARISNSNTNAELSELKAQISRFESELAAQKANNSEINELKARLASQEAHISSLRQQVARKGQGNEAPKSTSRRAMLKRMGGAAAALAAFGAIAPNIALADPNSAAVQATGDATTYGASFSSPLAPLFLAPGTLATTGVDAGAIATSTSSGGLTSVSLYRGAAGWTALSSTIYLQTPTRIIAYPGTTLAAGATQYFPVPTSAVPAGAAGILGSISVILPTVNAGAPGSYLTVFPGDQTTAPVVATIGYQAGSFVSTTSVTVRLGAIVSGANVGQPGIGIFNYNNGSATIAFDVFAYFFN